MFADLLTHDERVNLYGLLAHLATVDGEVSEGEREFLALARERLDLDSDSVGITPDDSSLEHICKTFSRAKARRVALVELLNIAFADDHYHEDERAGMVQIASLMGEDPAVLPLLEKWVADGIAWKQRGQSLILVP